MSGKKNVSARRSGSLPALRIGSRVRCTDDGVEGRITWANAGAVKIKWDDGEQVTWRRDSLAGRPIEILDAASDEDQQAAPTAPVQTDRTEPSQAEPSTPVTEPALPPPDQLAESVPADPTAMPEAIAREQTPTTDTQAEEAPPSEPSQRASTPPEQTAEQPETPSAVSKQPRTRKAKKATDDGQEKKLSALDAAAKVLGETGKPMSCKEMIEAMAARGYWTSPGGKTPQATLYSAIAREITTKGANSRFVKADRGKFALAVRE